MAKRHELKQNVAAHDPGEHNDLNGAHPSTSSEPVLSLSKERAEVRAAHGELVEPFERLEPLERTDPHDACPDSSRLSNIRL